jgi:hypothetical protein
MNSDLEDRAALIVVYLWCAAAIAIFVTLILPGVGH